MVSHGGNHRVFLGQIVYWLTGVYGGDYKKARDMLFTPAKV